MGVVGVARFGKGTVIVLGDDAIFANVAIDEGDNRSAAAEPVQAVRDERKTV